VIELDRGVAGLHYVLATRNGGRMAGRSTTETRSLAEQAMVSLLVAAGRIQQALNDVCAGYGITHDQYNVLRILRGVHPGGHPRYEIAERLINRAPDVTRLLDRLEGGGLVERVRTAEDRRLSVSRITPAGLALLDAMAPDIAGVHAHFADALSQADQRTLIRLCGDVK
jgi:DNA-binding MarR family transcriptional regulator